MSKTAISNATSSKTNLIAKSATIAALRKREVELEEVGMVYNKAGVGPLHCLVVEAELETDLQADPKADLQADPEADLQADPRVTLRRLAIEPDLGVDLRPTLRRFAVEVGL